MTCTFITSVLFRHDIYIFDFSVFKTWRVQSWHQSFSDMTSTLMTSVFLRQVIYIYNISVFLDVASTFITFMFFRHDISIDDISVFHMISNENPFIYRWMTKKTNSFDNRNVTFLKLNDDNTTIGPLVLVRVLVCITYLLLTLAPKD